MQIVNTIPALGFGTYGRTGEAGISAILHALELGYRHLDTAQDYGTEAECGQAWRRSGLPRDELFFTTKINPSNFGPGKLAPSLRRSLETIGLDRIDLTLIHWPSPHGELPLATYMEQLAEAQDAGLTRLIGVSNFTMALIEQSEKIIGAGRLANNQVELNPHLQNARLAEFCRQKGISVTCYLPIARGTLKGDPVIEGVAEAHGATVEQVALAFELAKGYIAIPTSGKREHIRSNFEARDIVLTGAEIKAIEGADRHHRVIDPSWMTGWD